MFIDATWCISIKDARWTSNKARWRTYNMWMQQYNSLRETTNTRPSSLSMKQYGCPLLDGSLKRPVKVIWTSAKIIIGGLGWRDANTWNPSSMCWHAKMSLPGSWHYGKRRIAPLSKAAKKKLLEHARTRFVSILASCTNPDAAYMNNKTYISTNLQICGKLKGNFDWSSSTCLEI